MKKSSIIFLIVTSVIICSILIYFQGINKEKGFKIGIILPLTGNLSFMGESEKNGFYLGYTEFLNQNPDLEDEIDIIFEDTQSEPKYAVNAAKKLIDKDKTKVLFVANTGPNLAIAPITKKEKVLQIAFCTESDIQKQHDLVFRLYQSATQEGRQIASYLNSNDFKKIGFLYIDQTNFVKTVDDIICPTLVNKELIKEKYKINETSFRTSILKFKTEKIDCLVLLGYGNEYNTIFNQLIELDLLSRIEIIGGWGFLYPQLSESELNGIKVVAPFFAVSDSGVSKTFKENYKKKFGVSPNFDAAYAYTAIQILLESMKNTTSFKINDIANHLEGGKFTTPVGPVEIKNRELNVKMGISVYSKNLLKPYN